MGLCHDNSGGVNEPITGFGYYVNLGYEGPLWSLALNYGDFFPGRTGTPQQDAATHRGLVKISRHWTKHFESYGVAFIENDLPHSFDGSIRRGLYFIVGGQFTW